MTSSVLSLQSKVSSPSQSKGKIQTSTEIISTVFPYQIFAPAMIASVNLETSLVSEVYTKSPEEPTSRSELPADQMLVATLTIENMEFTPELADSSSEFFKKLASDLELILNNVFEEIVGFLRVKVTSFKKGSIVCNFKIHMKRKSLLTAKDYEKALTAAAEGGKTGKYQISNVEVQDLNVGVVKGKESEETSFPVKVVGVAAFVGVVALIIVFLFYKVSFEN